MSPLFAGDPEYVPPVEHCEVEVTPGKFVPLEKWDWTVDDPKNVSQDEKTRIRIEFDDTAVVWEGVEIPVCMREHDGSFYMIGYDRETGRRQGTQQQRYTYYRAAGNRLQKIAASDFPRSIAIQNLWIKNTNLLRVTRELDISDPWFGHSVTAQVWKDLIKAERAFASDADIFRYFVEQHDPVKLTKIVRRKGGQ